MNKSEILRYMRTKSDFSDEKTLELVDTAIEKIESAVTPKTIFRIFDCEENEEGVFIGGEFLKSKKLSKTLDGCKRAVVFGATLTTECDRLIKEASATDIALALALQAAAACKIEEVCDELEEEIKKEYGVTLRQRYSPGYFDLDISEQKKVFELVDITKRIGITLTKTFEMVPTKSVTAIIGID